MTLAVKVVLNPKKTTNSFLSKFGQKLDQSLFKKKKIREKKERQNAGNKHF